MKPVPAFVFALLLAFSSVFNANAQSAESIWLTAGTTGYKTQETVVVTVNAVSATPIQGFTFQVRYDPACLQSVSATSPIPGMNGLSLPQTAGQVDASYASTTPQTVNGVLAEVRFVALKGCQTNLTLDSAALAIRTDAGFAAPLAGVTLGEKSVMLNIDQSVGVAQPTQPASAATLLLTPTPAPDQNIIVWGMGILAEIGLVGGLFGIFKLLLAKPKPVIQQKKPAMSQYVTLRVRHGPSAERNFILNSLPCRIGSASINDICLDDPHILGQHAQISAANNAYYLTDLGGETFVNGRVVSKGSAILKPGDVVRLGKSALLVFGA